MEIDLGSVAAAGMSAGASAVFKSTAERVQRTVRGAARAGATKALAALVGYGPYLEETNERVSTFKTFANPTQPVSLLDHFVTMEFERKRNSRAIDHNELLSKIIRPSRTVISATAGYGKSMVMRFMALSLYENPRGKIPLFLELRHLNRVTSPDLIAYINSSYRRVSDIEVESLRMGLASGIFVLLLDGFDELNHDLRPIIEEQILTLSRDYPLCSVVVSGRPDDRFNAWRSFSTYKVKPMSKTQVIELLETLEYDKGTKRRFISKIKKGLFESHESFLSTPLLAILMLLTFEQNANIPDKMHLFYSKAFETLFHKHDALKEQYDRARKSGLQVDEFEKVFSIFCLKTYVLEKTEFTKSEILNFINDALRYQELSIKSEDYLFDIEEAVCLVMREGSSYFFVHRSFQEYFTALFLANCPEETRDEFIDRVSNRYWDNVLPMLFDMSSDQIEPSWVVRNIDHYLTNVSLEDGSKKSPLNARFGGFSFQKYEGIVHFNTVMSGDYATFISIMRRFYSSISRVDNHVQLDGLEAFANESWNSLLCEHESLHKLASGDTISVKNVSLDRIPEKIIESTGLRDLANAEYLEIINIRSTIDESLRAKNAFLNKLFLGSSPN